MAHFLLVNSDEKQLAAKSYQRYKYVHFNSTPPLFFDLIEGPMEFNNVVETPAYQGRVLEYTQKLLSWRMNHDEQALTNFCLTDYGPVSVKN